jgi:DNA-binding protein H-NS
LNKRDVTDWFSGLAFEVQQTVLDEFGKVHKVSKEERISALEKEIAALRGGVRSPQAAPSAAKNPSPKKGMKVKPKYRHPETGETWAGRGVYPTWMREYLKKRGNKIETLLIEK